MKKFYSILAVGLFLQTLGFAEVEVYRYPSKTPVKVAQLSDTSAGSITDGGTYLKPTTNGDCLRVYDNTGTYYGQVCEDGTNVAWTNSGATSYTFDAPISVSGISSEHVFGNGYFINGDSATTLKIGSTGYETVCLNVESTSNTAEISDCGSTGFAKIDLKSVSLALSGATYTNIFQASGSQTASATYTWPTAAPSSNGYALLSTTGGVMSWGTPGATPAGSGSEVQYRASSSALGAIANTSTDGTTLSMTSPKIITGINDTNGNELFKFTATGSATNEITLANAANGSGPTLSATGSSDSNIPINYTSKGTGSHVFTSTNTGSSIFDTGIKVLKHIEGNGSAPALTSCGSGPSVTGTDIAFTITGGTSSTGCTATFATAFTNTPHCTVTNQSMSVVNAMTYTVSTTAVTISETGLGTAKIDVVCIGDV